MSEPAELSKDLIEYDQFLGEISSYDRAVVDEKCNVRKRQMMILSDENDTPLIFTKLNETNFSNFAKNKDYAFRWRYRFRRLTLIGCLVIGGIFAIAIFGSLIDRGNWLLPHSFALRNDNDEGILIPPDPEFPQPASWSKLRNFKRAVVCADGTPCAEIGKSMLDRNGSAVDAALAAMICNGFINMQSMGIGGGFLMTIYERSNGRSYFLNAREVAPLRSTPDMYDNKSTMASRVGGLAIGVPGEIAGYWEAHQRFGKLPWAELFHPSIRLCKEGYNLTKAQYDGLLVYPPNIYDDPTLREMFVVDPETRQFVKPGTLIRPRDLCETMQTIADNGAEVLYNGILGEKLVKDLKKRGSILTMQDLNNYRPLWSDPVRTKFSGGLELITSGLPSSGPLLAFILNVLDNYHFDSKSISNFDETIITYHRMVETWKYAYAIRTQLGDENFVDLSEIMNRLTSKEYARLIREEIRDDRTWNDPEHYGAASDDVEGHGTAHISVLGSNGDAVSVTSSINLYFGSGIVSETTGILMNSAMDDFGTTTGLNYFGIPAGKNNYIEPGKRSLSSMVPSIVLQDNGDVRMVIGGAGGTKITTSVSYIIARHLWMKNSIKEAIDAARIHHQLFPMTISYEFGVTAPILDGLRKLGHRTLRYKDRGSVVCAVARVNGTIYANADYRKNGDVYGID